MKIRRKYIVPLFKHAIVINERGYNPDWIERQLAYGDKDKIRAAYNYANYLPQLHKMMQDGADYLDNFHSGACSGDRTEIWPTTFHMVKLWARLPLARRKRKQNDNDYF